MKLLCLESSGPVCSVAMFEQQTLLGLKETREPYAHSSYMAAFTESLMKEHGKPNAVAVSSGPGSYTGLRIGVSLAKGLCSGMSIPLIAIPTLQILLKAFEASNSELSYPVPCIDARRMEVYTATFSPQGDQLVETRALVVEEEEDFGVLKKKVLFGDGADKLTDLLKHRSDITVFPNISPSAQFMGSIGLTKFEARDFEDIAYFEPFYLKEFIALKPKKK